MTRQVLFIQGGGEGGYEADKALVSALQESLGSEYEIVYPELRSDESAPDFGWIQQIDQLISNTGDEAIIVGHSLGASMLLKCLSENTVVKKIKGIFLIATPFWSGNENWKTGLKLHNHFANNLPGEVPIFFYHCKDDEVVPFSHLQHYKQQLSKAIVREFASGGHQLHSGISALAKDIKSLK